MYTTFLKYMTTRFIRTNELLVL